MCLFSLWSRIECKKPTALTVATGILLVGKVMHCGDSGCQWVLVEEVLEPEAGDWQI